MVLLSMILWQKDLFIKMGNNTAQKEIADGYAIILWDELEKEEDQNSRVIPPQVIGLLLVI